jgi:hypothetical protein
MTRLLVRARTIVVVVAALLGFASCGTGVSFPAAAPDARGTLAPYNDDGPAASYPPGVGVFHLTIDDDRYSYFADAVLSIDDDTVIGNQFGDVLSVTDLSAGDAVDVWTDACAESFPVQCRVTHLRLTSVD